MNALVPSNFGTLSTRFQGQAISDEFAAGIEASYGMIGYRGKVWSIKYRGNETPLMRDDGDGPRGSIEAILVQSSAHKSKVWYENGYVDGSNAKPDCFSNNGVTPDPQSPKKQCASCAACPKNAFGTGANGKGKACSDSKRMVVVPLGDISNDVFGGPMLLRVPAASLDDLATYATAMKQQGYPVYGIGTRISFDPAESYPKFKFGGIRPLTDAEADQVLALRDTPIVKRILAEGSEVVAGAPQAQPATALFEQPPATPAPAPVAAPVTPPVTQPVAPTAQLPAPQATAGGIVEVTSTAVKSTGFGPVTTAAKPVETPAAQGTNADFEKSLDDKLAAFLPAA